MYKIGNAALMNYLAHLFLADGSSELLVGGLLGDFLRGDNPNRYSAGIQEGIRLHREIDRFTDSHPVFLRSKNRMPPPYRRYAGVLVDIFYDHFLAASWPEYSPDVPLDEFCGRAYGVLSEYEPLLAPRLRRMLPRMIEENWLASYATCAGVDQTLKRLSKRLKRPNPLPHAVRQLEEHYPHLESDFRCFFPEVRRCAQRFRAASGLIPASCGVTLSTFRDSK